MITGSNSSVKRSRTPNQFLEYDEPPACEPLGLNPDMASFVCGTPENLRRSASRWPMANHITKAIRGGPERLVGQVSIAVGRLRLCVPKQLSDSGK